MAEQIALAVRRGSKKVRVLEIFIDGFGLGENDSCVNPIVAGDTPCLDTLLAGHNFWGASAVETSGALLRPLDTSLGVPGAPQSATGQTTLWTGVNGAKAAGRHVNAYPTEVLQKVIAEHSIFKTLTGLGYRATFANAFRPQFFELLAAGKRNFSTSTLTVMAAGVPLRTVDDLVAGKAVYQDITNDILIGMGLEVPRYTPGQAGRHLAAVAREHDFTLFEFFQSDKAGHKQDMECCVALVEMLDEFLAAVVDNLPREDYLVLLTSDHGNLEDLRVKGHTHNPVPALLIGDYGRTPYHRLKSIEDVAPFVLSVITGAA